MNFYVAKNNINLSKIKLQNKPKGFIIMHKGFVRFGQFVFNKKQLMVIYKEESYKIVGAAFEVYNKLGHGFLEAVYQEALEIEFQRQGIPYEREKELKISYDDVELKQTYKADFVCYDKIIVELKAVSALEDAHRSQVYNYLHATGFKLGILLNFGKSGGLEIERIVL